MKPTETVLLTEYVHACCPQQAIGEYTADAWHDLLGDLPLAECKQAVAEVAKRQPFVAPAEIREQVQAARRERVRDAEIPAPPAELTDNPPAYIAHLRRTTRQIADGLPERKALRS